MTNRVIEPLKSRPAREFEITIRVLRGPLRSTRANNAAACEARSLTQPCDSGRLASPPGASDQPIANGAPYHRLLIPC
jgi:hypothetical protein